ncbi:MAG: hypothetical protein ISQ11_14225 [Planctomycetes bacterium]|nr:hypothetical protein [Planctomycetota bacterium]
MDPLKQTLFSKLVRGAAALLLVAMPVQAHGDPEQEVDVSLVVVSAAEDAIALFDPDSGERRAFFRVGNGPTSAAVSSDGRTAVVTLRGRALSGNSICVVDLHAAAIVRTIALTVSTKKADGSSVVRSYHRPDDVIFLPGEARVLVSCAAEGALLQVDLLQKKVVGVAEFGRPGADDIVLGHDGRVAFVTNRKDGVIYAVNLANMSVLKRMDAGGGATGVALHPTRTELWATNSTTNTISIIDCEKLEERMEFPCGAMPVDIAFTPDGKNALVVNYQDGNVSVIDARSLRVRALIKVPRVSRELAEARPVAEPVAFGRSALPSSVAVDPAGDRGWVTAERSDQIFEVDLSTWKVLRGLKSPGAPAHVTRAGLTAKALTSPIVPIAPVAGPGGVSTDPWERSFPGGGLPSPPEHSPR